MGRMKEMAIIRDNEQGYCPNVEFLLALALANGEEVEEIHCKCEVCREQAKVEDK